MTKAKRFLAENSLSLFFLALFLAALAGQAIADHSLYDQEQSAHGEAAIGFWRYVTSSSFGQAVMENWQSEYLQFALFALATVWLSRRVARVEGARQGRHRVRSQAESGRPGAG